jgi:hypothetical protein
MTDPGAEGRTWAVAMVIVIVAGAGLMAVGVLALVDLVGLLR